MLDEAPPSNKQSIADDLLTGAAEIGAELGLSETQVYYLVRMKRLPVGRMGKLLIASRTRLRKAVANLTS